MDPCHPRHPRQNFMDLRYPRHPRQNLTHATHAKHGTHEPTPTMLFSRLKFQIHAAGFVRLLYLVEKGEKVLKRFIFYYWIEIRYVLVRENGLYFNMGKVLLKCS